MMVITDGACGALSAPQRAVLALKAAWAGNRPDPRLLAMPPAQRAEFDRLFRDALRANVNLGRLIRELRAQAKQESLAVATWVFETWHAAVLDQARATIGEGDRKVARVLEGGGPLACPVRLDDLDETPAGRRAQVLKGSRDRLMGIAARAHATEEILEVIRGELGANPLSPELTDLLDWTFWDVEDALLETVPWLGPIRCAWNPQTKSEVRRMFESGR